MTETTLEKLASWENLFFAWQKASRGKRGKADVAFFEYRLEENLLSLQKDLLLQQWQTSGYQSFFVHDPKRRLISAAPFADRVVHHALCQVIEPLFERSFTADSFANRLGKGNHRALDRTQQYAKRFPYVLSLDIIKFFPSIDHKILYGQLSSKIKNEQLLNLVAQIIASGNGLFIDEGNSEYFAGDDLLDILRPKGLPIGNLTSQFWANVYLNSLDHFIKRTLRCQGYVRYVDDMLLFARDKRTLWFWKQEISDYLLSLRLHIHAGAHPRPVTEGFGFLGFRIFPGCKRLKKRKGVQYQRHLKKLLAGYQANLVGHENILDSVLAWNNHLSYGNTVGLRKNVFSVLTNELAQEARVRYTYSLERKNRRLD